MDERILNLFNLCRLAQEKGHKIEFTYGRDLISIWNLSENLSDMRLYPIDLQEDNEQQFINAEDYLKELIA